MASLVTPQQKHYDVLAEAVTADGRVVKKVEARAESLPDVTEAFRLAAAEAEKAHVKPARIRLTASRAGTVELAVNVESAEVLDPLAQSALLDGKTKVDAPPPAPPKVDWSYTYKDALARDIDPYGSPPITGTQLMDLCRGLDILLPHWGPFYAEYRIDEWAYDIGGQNTSMRYRLSDTMPARCPDITALARRIAAEMVGILTP